MASIWRELLGVDKYLELNPERRPSHWQRGISCYYAGMYDEGRKQFEAYQTFLDNDVAELPTKQWVTPRSELGRIPIEHELEPSCAVGSERI